MLNFLFGRTFWPTVIRAALFLPLLGVITFPLALVFTSSEEIAALQNTSAATWTIQTISSLIFGAWVGWGVAYWRFEVRPIGKGWFAIFPLITGSVLGPLVFWSLTESAPMREQIDASEKTAAMIFGAVTMPFMALVTSAFWRYALNLTALKRDRR